MQNTQRVLEGESSGTGLLFVRLHLDAEPRLTGFNLFVIHLDIHALKFGLK